MDNFYVRSFAGKSTFLKPLGRIDSKDLESAKETLSNFEVCEGLIFHVVVLSLPGEKNREKKFSLVLFKPGDFDIGTL